MALLWQSQAQRAASRPWWKPGSQADRLGYPVPLGGPDRRSPPAVQVPMFGGVMQVAGPLWDQGAAGYAPQFGQVLSNPIGAGIVTRARPQASYGPAGQYVNGYIWWVPQTVPTSLQLGGLTSPQELQALLGTVNVQAAVRVG